MKKQTLHTILSLKNKKEPITVLTAYDYTFSKLLSEQGIEILLIGDSLGMTIQGHQSTVPVTIQDMCYHTRCVAAGNQGALLVADMPYMSYSTTEQALINATQLMQAGANMVKLEGGEWLANTVKTLTQQGIPVCCHLGLTPQSVDLLGGYKVQGREKEKAKKIMDDAKILEQAGAKIIFLECIPKTLATQITRTLSIATIGIGAGVNTDGQVLVLQDMLGLNPHFKPTFAKDFMQESKNSTIADAIKNYIQAVKSKSFPTDEYSFD